MVQVEFTKKTSNPFYGMQNTLELYQNASKGMNINDSKLESAWNECNSIDQKAVLLSILFSVGDITGREHNIFSIGKVESGGYSERETFRDVIIPFLVSKVSKSRKPVRLKLIDLIVEYTVMDNVLAARIKTRKNTSKVIGVINMIEVFGIEDLSSYAIGIITKGSLFKKTCLAKFLTRPRFSKRSGSTQMLPETRKVMTSKYSLIHKISEKMGWPIEIKNTYTNYPGYYNWRKEFNKDLESVLFSSQNINNLDREGFIEFIDKLPSNARFRVKNRVTFSKNEDESTLKWPNLSKWYQEWEDYKDQKQKEQRELETIISEGGASDEVKAKLNKVKKEAKVNTGAISFTKMYQEIITGTVDKVKIQPFLDKVNLPYNTLTFIDDSGSMNSHWGSNYGFTPRQFAAFMATIILSKNPDPEARNLVGLFSRTCRMANGISTVNTKPNSILNGKNTKRNRVVLVDSNKHFLDNLNLFTQFLNANSTGAMTYVSRIPDEVNKWVNGDPQKLEELQRFPVWTLISDGNFNNLGRASSSLNDFFRRCEIYFGFKPYLILIDVAGNTSQKITQFSGIDNVMMVPPNPANIEMLLTNFKDIDTYDVYTPLQSVFRSKRYAPVRELVEKL